jgi:signal transduction histidine kinase
VANSKENEREKSYRLLNETGRIAKIGGWELDVATGELTWTDETFRILEVEKKNQQRPMLPEGLALFTPDSAPIIDRAVKRAIEFGEPYNLELQALTAKGNVVWVQTNGVANYVNGKIVSVSGTIQDITERKNKERETKFLSESLGFGIWIFDPVTQALEWDAKMYEIFDVNPAEFSGAYSAWESCLSPAAKEKAVQELGLALRGEKEFNSEFEIVLKNGKIRHIAGRGLVFRNEKNEPIKMYGVNWDVSERVAKENQLKAANVQLVQSAKLASLGEMSAAIAHEINNPLAIIKASADLISGKFKNDPQRFAEKVDGIKKSCDRIAKIVNGLRKFARSGEVGDYSLHSIDSLVAESISLVNLKAKNNNTAVEIDCRTQTKILCNEVEIEQVFVNLISNAIDAVKPQTEKWVKIKVFEDNSEVIVEVSDSGLGIPESIRAKIFDPFFTTKAMGEGTGLGLSISKGILDEHKASIKILENCENTCFQIRFKKTMES